jgi:hypothetical protein
MSNRTDSERIASIETSVVNIEKRLFGNGQPGDIGMIHERITLQGKRIAKLENWRWWVVGVAVGAGVVGGAGLHKIVEAIAR